MNLAKDLAGPGACSPIGGPSALLLGFGATGFVLDGVNRWGGRAQMQRTVIGERTLGLSPEPRVAK
jgi:hypothetical protein